MAFFWAGEQNSLSIPLFFFFFFSFRARTVCCGKADSEYQECRPQTLTAYIISSTLNVQLHVPPTWALCDWHRHRLGLSGFQLTPLLEDVAQCEMFYFLVRAGITERKMRYWTDRNKTSANYTLLTDRVMLFCVTHPLFITMLVENQHSIQSCQKPFIRFRVTSIPGSENYIHYKSLCDQSGSVQSRSDPIGMVVGVS